MSGFFNAHGLFIAVPFLMPEIRRKWGWYMFEPQMINVYCVLIGAFVGVATWRMADKKDIGQDAAWRARVDEKLANVDTNTTRILLTLDKSDERIQKLENDVAHLQSDVKTLFSQQKEKNEH